MLPKAYEVLRLFITDYKKHPRIALEIAWKVVRSQCAPDYSENRPEVAPTVAPIDRQSEDTEQAVQSLLDSVAATTPDIAKNPLNPIRTPSPHLRTSGEEK